MFSYRLFYHCLTIDSGVQLSAPFQRMPSKRALPDYFEVIREPMALSTIRVIVMTLVNNIADLSVVQDFTKAIW